MTFVFVPLVAFTIFVSWYHGNSLFEDRLGLTFKQIISEFYLIGNRSNSLLIKQHKLYKTIIQSAEISQKDNNKVSNITFNIKYGLLLLKRGNS